MRTTGAPEVIRKLRSMPQELATKHLQKAVMAASEPIQERMAATARKGDPRPPTLSNIVVNRVRNTDPMAAGAWIGPEKEAYYGIFLEYGTKHMSAKPFARPALDTEGPAAQAVLKDEVWAAILAVLR